MSSKKIVIQNMDPSGTKDKESTNLTSLHKVIHKLIDEVLDLKKSMGEGAYVKKYYKPYHKHQHQAPHIKAGLNFDECAMDDYCRPH